MAQPELCYRENIFCFLKDVYVSKWLKVLSMLGESWVWKNLHLKKFML